MFGPVDEEKAEGCNKLYGKELSALYSSSNMSGVIKSMEMRWAGYVAHTRKRKREYKILAGNIKGRDQRGISTKTEENMRTGPSKYVCVRLNLLRIGSSE